MNKKRLQDLLVYGKTEEAFKEITENLEKVQDQHIRRNLTLLAGDYNALMRDKYAIKDADFELKEKKIRHGLLELLSQLNETDFPPETKLPGEPETGGMRAVEMEKIIQRLEKEIHDLTEAIVELSNEVYEKQNIVTMSKNIFQTEFKSYLVELETLDRIIKETLWKIGYKRENPEATRAQVESRCLEYIHQLQIESENFEAEMKRAENSGGRAGVKFISQDEYEKAKDLWRTLIRKVHPDILGSDHEDPFLGKCLSELYEMKGNYDLGHLYEIEARIGKYDKDKQLGVQENTGSRDLDAELKNLELRLSKLHFRKKNLIQEIEKVENDEYYQYREFISHPEIRETYLLKLELKIEFKKKEANEIVENFNSLF